MSFLATTDINIGGTDLSVQTTHNVIDPTLATYIVDNLTNITTVSNLGSTANFSSYVSLVQTELLNLRNLVKDGHDGFRVSVPIAQDLQLLFNTFNSVAPNGTTVVPSSGSITLDTSILTKWRDLGQVNNQISTLLGSLNGVTTNVIGTGGIDDAGKETGSLQAMIELIYIKGANEFISDKLGTLQDALTTTKDALDVLGGLQNLHNIISSQSAGRFTFDSSQAGVGSVAETTDNIFQGVIPPGAPNLTDDAQITAAKKNFSAAATDFFGTPPPIDLGPGLADLPALFTQQNTLLDTLSTQMSTTAITNLSVPAGTGEDLNLQRALFASEASAGGVNSLETKITNGTVIDDVHRSIITLFLQYIENYNRLTKQIKTHIQPILDLAAKEGITQIQVGSVPFNLSDFDKMRTFPTPPFTAVDLKSAIPVNGSTQKAILAWIKELKGLMYVKQSTFPTNIDADTQSGPTLFKNTVFFQIDTSNHLINSGTSLLPFVNSTTSRSGFTGAQFISAIYNYQLPSGIRPFLNGDVSKGLSPLPIMDFYNKIKAQVKLLDDTITTLSTDPKQGTDPNSLLTKLRKVRDDIDGAGYENMFLDFVNPTNSDIDAVLEFAKKWIIDNNTSINDGSNQIGLIQNNLGFAISAAQSLNDKQKTDVQNALFIFEEFYKSASAILTKLAQIFSQIAQGINR